MKACYKLAACAVLLLAVGAAVRPAAGQTDCAAITTKDGCVSKDKTVETGCCWTGDACSAKNDTHTASPDGGMCRGREVLNFGESSDDGECPASTQKLCNPGTMDAPAGCSVNTTTCYMTMGKPTLSAVFMGTGDNSSIKPCARGMNFAIDKIENNTAFLYTDDKPMAILIPPGGTLTISAPEVADGFRPGLRVTHAYLNPAASGNHTLSWKVTVAATGETTEGDCIYPPSKEEGVDDPEGWPIDPVHSWSLTNKATDQTVEVARFVFNRC